MTKMTTSGNVGRYIESLQFMWEKVSTYAPSNTVNIYGMTYGTYYMFFSIIYYLKGKGRNLIFKSYSPLLYFCTTRTSLGSAVAYERSLDISSQSTDVIKAGHPNCSHLRL